MRFSYHPRCGSVLVALTVLVVSLLAVAKYDSESPNTKIDPAPKQQQPDFTSKNDMMSAMQGKVQLDPLSATAVGKQKVTNDISETKPKASGLYTVSDLGPVQQNDPTLRLPRMGILSLQETLKQMSSTETAAISVIAIVMIASLLICTCIGAFSIAYPDKFPLWGDRRYAQAEDDEVPVPALQQRELQVNRKGLTPPGSGVVSDYLQYAWSPFTTAATLHSQAVMTQDKVPGTAPALETQDALAPPPLCPSLVMPLCQARFGLAMFELAEVAGEGEVNVVGPSGNPLLRAVVRKVGNSRTLEISMLEANSSPRATISPAMSQVGGHIQSGCKALEIRGMRGVFYGTLEMRSSGTCSVVRDGQPVLSVDGDAESLQLSLTSGSGKPLAAVRCSDQSFAGNDHVEIVVEAGVDTVLCLAVVLAVLLLSPYVKDN